MNPTIAAWLPDVIVDVVTIVPHNIQAEAQKNQWSFSVTRDEAAGMTPHDIEEFIMCVVRARRESLIQGGLPCGALTFYCWFDEMACQLRFSIVSAKQKDLPFRCDTANESLLSIGIAFLSSQFHEGIPWSEFFSEEPTEATPSRKLPVWSISIP